MPRPPRLSLDMMETLVILFECEGDASMAADMLEINQPSMSKRLGILQHSNPLARYPWLEKQGKLWVLTHEGERNLPAIRDIVRTARNLQEDLDERVERAPDISIACGQLAVQTFVRHALLKFRKRNPELRIRVSTPRGEERILGVATGHYDVAIVTHDEADILNIAKRPLHVENLFEDPWVATCSNKAPKEIRQKFESLPGKITFADLVGFPLLLPEPDAGMRKKFDRAVIAAGLQDKLSVRMELGGWNTLLEFVKDGWGIGIVSRQSSLNQKLMTKELQAEKDWQPAAVRLITRPIDDDQTESTSLQELTELIKEASPK
ncbi:substrate-binding domain-containing protein [Rubinisphaera italica]|uniref:Transcriptional regulator CysB-like protein n=1 Tax=Rubinisphaera italica TaxID=2527969 RepID=A0A5C5XMP1_9PLAN|nr:substrate-binding domain-containing protein [Rubinisphaera italica]TWT63741.1 transcriptional regulator CysB-like protein [Rubinisphaera italica]